MSNQLTDEERRTQQAVWAAMRVRAKMRDAVTALDNMYLQFPETEGLLHARTYASSLAGMQDGFIGGLQMLMRKLPSPVADMPHPLEPEHTLDWKPVARMDKHGVILNQVGPATPGTASIAIADDDHIIVRVPCQTDGCLGTLERYVLMADHAMRFTVQARCPLCEHYFRIDYEFGKTEFQVTPLDQGDTLDSRI